jgi:hypothetical protein
LGEEATFTLNYLEGQRVAVYAAGVGQGLILVVVVPKMVKQGTVLVYARKAASEIEQIAPNASVQEGAMPVPAQSQASEPRPEPAFEPSPVQPQPAKELDVLFSEETLAAGTGLSDSVQTLSWEEAVARGLIGDLKL